MDGAVHGLTAYAALRMILPDSLAVVSTLGGIALASSKSTQNNLRIVTLIAHYYVLASVAECVIHKYQMHGKFRGKWLNTEHIDHHLNVSHNMTLKHPIEDDNKSGEFGWTTVIKHTIILHLITTGYVSRVFHVHPTVNAITWCGISLTTAFLWNTIHNSMHDDDHRHSISRGPPRMMSSQRCAKTFGGLFTHLKRHHELHHVIKSRKTNFGVVFLGADKLLGFTPTKEEMDTINVNS